MDRPTILWLVTTSHHLVCHGVAEQLVVDHSYHLGPGSGFGTRMSPKTSTSCDAPGSTDGSKDVTNVQPAEPAPAGGGGRQRGVLVVAATDVEPGGACAS